MHSYIESLPKSFFCKPCTDKEVYLELMRLNEKKAVGIENIPIKFLKMTAECASLLLSKIFNKCISKGVFPSKLKIAKVTPLHKSGCSMVAHWCHSIFSCFIKKHQKKIPTLKQNENGNTFENKMKSKWKHFSKRNEIKMETLLKTK